MTTSGCIPSSFLDLVISIGIEVVRVVILVWSGSNIIDSYSSSFLWRFISISSIQSGFYYKRAVYQVTPSISRGITLLDHSLSMPSVHLQLLIWFIHTLHHTDAFVCDVSLLLESHQPQELLNLNPKCSLVRRATDAQFDCHTSSSSITFWWRIMPNMNLALNKFKCGRSIMPTLDIYKIGS